MANSFQSPATTRNLMDRFEHPLGDAAEKDSQNSANQIDLDEDEMYPEVVCEFVNHINERQDCGKLLDADDFGDVFQTPPALSAKKEATPRSP